MHAFSPQCWWEIPSQIKILEVFIVLSMIFSVSHLLLCILVLGPCLSIHSWFNNCFAWFLFNNITNAHSHCIPPFDLQVKSDVRRLKGIPALVSMLDNPHREVSLLFFSKAFCSLFAVLEGCYDWAKSEA